MLAALFLLLRVNLDIDVLRALKETAGRDVAGVGVAAGHAQEEEADAAAAHWHDARTGGDGGGGGCPPLRAALRHNGGSEGELEWGGTQRGADGERVAVLEAHGSGKHD